MESAGETTYGKITEDIMEKLCTMDEVHFICDVYKEPSLKDVERKRRGGAELAFPITEPGQRIPKDCSKHWSHQCSTRLYSDSCHRSGVPIKMWKTLITISVYLDAAPALIVCSKVISTQEHCMPYWFRTESAPFIRFDKLQDWWCPYSSSYEGIWSSTVNN